MKAKRENTGLNISAALPCMISITLDLFVGCIASSSRSKSFKSWYELGTKVSRMSLEVTALAKHLHLTGLPPPPRSLSVGLW